MKKNKTSSLVFQQEDLSLPETATTRNGVVFRPRESRWAYRDGSEKVNLDFSSIGNVSQVFMSGLKLVLLWFVENKSPAHAKNMFWYISQLLVVISKDDVVSEISDLEIMNYQSQLDVNRKWYLAFLAGFLKKWHALGVPGVTKGAVELLSQIRKKGNPKGVAVLTMDPVIGPFTDIERNALFERLNIAYAGNAISIEDYLLCFLVSILGQRPVQYSYLKVCDVINEKLKDGSDSYIIRIPRAKQRGQLPRSEFKERALIPQIGQLLVNYSKTIEHFFAKKLQDPRQAPLFPDANFAKSYPSGFEFHQTSSSINLRVNSIFSKLNVISERTGSSIHIAPIRFRRTLGTQAAAEGHGPLVIAELLDHADLQNVGCYVAATPEILERIDRAVAARLAPLAQAFSGVLVDGNAEHGVPPGQRIVAPKFSSNFDPVGSCGYYGFCAFAAPIACYTCSSFRAWLDGPHADILDFLLAERDRLMKTDVRVASVNDRTILAVAQVVEMCIASQNRQASDV